MSTEYANLGFRVDSNGLLTADQRLKSVANSGRTTDAQVTTLNKTFSGLTSTLGLATTALGLIGAGMSIKGVIDYSDAWSNVNSQLRQVTNSEQDLISTRSQLLKITKETRSELTNTVDLYATMTRSTTELNISSERLMDVTKTLNNLFVSGGKPISEVEGAIRQLNQGLAAGALRGDEFNSVAEGAPKVMDALAAKLQMTRGELRNFAATGGITSEILISALEDYQVTAQKLADQTAKTFGQNLQNATSNVTEFVGNSESLNSAVGSLGNGIESLSENLDALTDAGIAFATVYGGAVVVAAGKSAVATYANVAANADLIISQRAQMAQVAEMVSMKSAQSAAESKTAAAAKAASVSRLQSNVAMFESEIALEQARLRAQISETGRIQSGLRLSEISASRTIATKQLAVAETELALATARVAATESASAVTKTKAAAATELLNNSTKRAVVSTTALGVATKFLLGPWGLLLTAVAAGASMFISAKNDSDDLTMSLDEQAAKLARLNSVYGEMAKTDLESERNKLLERSNEILFERMAIEEKINKLSDNATIQMGMETVVDPQVLAEINKLESALESLSKESKEIDEPLKVIIKTLGELHPVLGKNVNNAELTEKANKKAAQSYADMVKNLENERQQLILTSDEFEIYMIRQQASANQWTPEMTTQIIKQTRALQDQRAAIETTDAQLESMMSGDLFGFGGDNATQELSSDLDSLTDQVDNFGGAWTRTGNVIADSMGDAVSILDDFASKMQSIEKLQADLTAEREEYADGAKEAIAIDESLARLQQESAAAQIGAIGQTIGLSAQLFKENSKERKALHALEMGFMTAEIALATEKAVVNAVNAVATQGSGDPYSAFGRIAAMVGIMAGLLGAAGIAFSSGGGGGGYEAPTGGTGTTLGDSTAQSASINNSMDRFEDIQTDQLSELQGIRQSMNQLSSGIENLAKSFAQGLDFDDSGYGGQLGTSKQFSGNTMNAFFAGERLIDDLLGGTLNGIVSSIFGGISKTSKKLIDSGITFVSQTMESVFDSGEFEASMFHVIETTKKKFWGLSKSTSTSTETSSIGGAITQQMGDIFGYIGDTVVSAAESLGLDTKHIITTGLESLSLDEALDNFAIDIGNVSFSDKTGEEIQEELEAIFSQQADLMTQYLTPAIAEYQQVGEGLFDTLTRLSYEQAIFNDAIERTGVAFEHIGSLSKIDISQSIIKLVGGIEEFSELADSFFSSFYSESDQLNYMEESIGNYFDTLGLAMVDTKEEFKDLVTGIDITTEGGQQLYAALLQISPAMADYTEALEDLANDKLSLQIDLLNAQGKSTEALALSRQMELGAADESLHAIMQQIWALNDAATAENERAQAIAEAQAVADAKTNMNIRMLTAMGESEQALALQRELELSATDESLRAQLRSIYAIEDAIAAEEARTEALEEAASAMESQLSELQSASDSFADITDSINSIIYSAYDVSGAMSYTLDRALSLARSGDFSASSDYNLSSVGDISSYNSATDFEFAQAVAVNKLSEIAQLSSSAESLADRAIMSIESNIVDISENSKSDNVNLELIKDYTDDNGNKMSNFISALNDDSASKDKEIAELRALVSTLNKNTAQNSKTLSRIEQNTYEAIR